MSFDRLINNIVDRQNPSVMGLDPTLDYIPDSIKRDAFREKGETLAGAAEAIFRFNKGLIDACKDVVPAIKPQCAYYEMYGVAGFETLHRTIQYGKENGLFVIIDGKRGDIGSTMTAYATGHLGLTQVGETRFPAMGGDALTVNGYFGVDGITPLTDVCKQEDKGIFVLVRTSNPSAGQFQDLKVGDRTVYDLMGDLCEEWGEACPGQYGYTGVGAVVGATWPQQLSELRARLPHTFFLVPGYGAQGGGAKDVMGGFDKRGLGSIINASRSIMCAWKKTGKDGTDFMEAARAEAVRMKEALMEGIGTITR